MTVPDNPDLSKYPPELNIVEIGTTEVRTRNHIHSQTVRWFVMTETLEERQIIGRAFSGGKC